MSMDYSFLADRQQQIILEGDVHHSAVMIPLIHRNDDDHVLFEIRSENIRHQPGDICLPGGGVEDGENPLQAAVREVTEELLVKESQIKEIMPVDLFVTGSLVIHIYLCRLENYDGNFNPDEVSEVFTVPLSYFLSTSPEIYEMEWKPDMDIGFPFDKIHGGKDYGWRKHMSRIRFYEYDTHVIWGITARIMDHFAALCNNAEKVKRDGC